MPSPTSSPDPVWRSYRNCEVPAVDIVSYTFGKLQSRTVQTPIFVNADTPSSYLTVQSVHDLVSRFCSGWKHVGLEPGECVTICCPNNILFPPIWLSVIGSGAIVSGVNPSLTVSELEHHIEITETKWLIGHREHAQNLLEAAVQRHIDSQHVLLFDDDLIDGDASSYSSGDETGSPSSSTTSYREDDTGINSDTGAHNYTDLCTLLTHGKQPWQSHCDPFRPAVYATTSGTTGLPKAAVLPHQYLVSQALMLEGDYESRHKPIQLICLPIFHTFGGNCALVLPLRLGITTYFMSRFKADDFIEAISQYAITDAPLVPPIISTLVQKGEELGNRLQSLRRIICAGSSMNPAVQNSLYKFLHSDCRISQCWGATETGWVTLTPARELDQSGSVGELTMNTQLKLMDSGNVVSDEDVTGEALVKTTSLFLGYLHNDKANAEAFDDDGFYRSGDRAYFKGRRVFIKGRIKDTLKVNAWQVSPEELEEKIQNHPSVVDCAVVGHNTVDAAGLEQTEPRAYVVIAPDCLTTTQDIAFWVSSQTVHYKHLTGGVFFVDDIPRNASGKILRRLLIARGD